MQGIYGFLFFLWQRQLMRRSLSLTHTREHVHPLHLHALRAQMHLIAQRVTYTPCGTGNKPEKPWQSEREREQGSCLPITWHQQVAGIESEREWAGGRANECTRGTSWWNHIELYGSFMASTPA